MGGFRAFSEGRTNRKKHNGLEVGNERERGAMDGFQFSGVELFIKVR